MFRLSNLVTTLFGIIAALGTILGIGSVANLNPTATQPSDPQAQPDPEPTLAATPSDGTTSLTAQDLLAQPGARQVGQNAPGDTATTTAQADGNGTEAAGENPSAPFIVQGEGAVLTTEPAPPSVPSEAVAIELDPSPGAVSAPATVSNPAPVIQASEPAPAPTTVSDPAPPRTPVRAMW